MFSENFTKMMGYLLQWEGRMLEYDADDPGGITCCGISKVAYPKWKGWDHIDLSRMKDKSYTGILLLDGSPVMDAVLEQYHTLWMKYDLDEYAFSISMEIMDQIVNPGPHAMATNAQQVLNAMNYSQKYGDDLVVDGGWGPSTKKRLQQVIDDNKDIQFAIAMNCEQGSYYRNVTMKNSKKRKWYAGWLKRCELIR